MLKITLILSLQKDVQLEIDYLANNHLIKCFCIFAFENHQNFKGDMTNEYSIDSFTIPESVMEAWQDNYTDMKRFFIYGESLEFDELMYRIEELQKRVKMM